MAEEVVTQEAAAQFCQEAEHIAHAVHHRQTPQVLFSIKGSRDWKTRNSNLELDTGSEESNSFYSQVGCTELHWKSRQHPVSVLRCHPKEHAALVTSPLSPRSVTARLPLRDFHDCGGSD